MVLQKKWISYFEKAERQPRCRLPIDPSFSEFWLFESFWFIMFPCSWKIRIISLSLMTWEQSCALRSIHGPNTIIAYFHCQYPKKVGNLSKSLPMGSLPFGPVCHCGEWKFFTRVILISKCPTRKRRKKIPPLVF